MQKLTWLLLSIWMMFKVSYVLAAPEHLRIQSNSQENSTELAFSASHAVQWKAHLVGSKLVIVFHSPYAVDLARVEGGFGPFVESAAFNDVRRTLTLFLRSGNYSISNKKHLVLSQGSAEGTSRTAQSHPITNASPPQTTAKASPSHTQTPPKQQPGLAQASDAVPTTNTALPPANQPIPLSSPTKTENATAPPATKTVAVKQSAIARVPFPAFKPITPVDVITEYEPTQFSGTLPLPDDSEDEVTTTVVTDNQSLNDANTIGPEDLSGIPFMRFAMPSGTGSSVFVRGDHLWIIFDYSKPIDLGIIRAQYKDYISSTRQLDNKHFTILHLGLKQDIKPTVRKQKDDWYIYFTKTHPKLLSTASIQIKSSQLHGTTIVIADKSDVRPIRLIDPVVGDELIAIVHPKAGHGFEDRIRYTDFSIMEASQGMALQLIADRIDVSLTKKGVELVGPTNRLAGSAQSALHELQERERLARLREEQERAKHTELALIKFNTWGKLKNPKHQFRQDLQDAQWQVTLADWRDKSERRLDLARFYLSHSMEAEALGVIGVIEEYDREFAATNDVLMIKAAAYYLMGRYKAATLVFDEIDYSSFPVRERNEANFWRAAANIRLTSTIELDAFLTGQQQFNVREDSQKNEEEEETTPEEEIDDSNQEELTKLILETSDRLLKMIRNVEPEFANQQEVETLISTTQFVASHYQEAIKRFEQSAESKQGDGFEVSDGAVWWGTTDTQTDNQVELLFLEYRNNFLQYYPKEVYNDFALLSLEERLAKNDLIAAQEILDTLFDEERTIERNSIEFFRGLFYAKDENIDKAVEQWELLVEDTFDDPFNRARSQYALATVMYNNDIIDLEDAINLLDATRIQWRGDILELNILKTLGKYYIDKHQYAEGFKVWREIISSFPGSDESLQIAKDMSERFVQLFSQEQTDDLSPIQALTLFYEYRSLIPIGKLGNDMVERLVDRMVEMDLLHRAAAILTHQVRFHLTGMEKDVAANKLVKIHLMNNTPQLALDVINATNHGAIDEVIALERKYLKATALIELGMNNRTLSLLRGDDRNEATFLRAELYWREKIWKKVIDELEPVFRTIRREEKNLEREEMRQIIRLALAYAISGRKIQLQILYEDFAKLVTDDKNRAVLAFIATDRGPVDYRNLESTVELSDMQDFLEGYMDTDLMSKFDTKLKKEFEERSAKKKAEEEALEERLRQEELEEEAFDELEEIDESSEG